MYLAGGIRPQLAFATLVFAFALARGTARAEGDHNDAEASDEKTEGSNEKGEGSGDQTEGTREKSGHQKKAFLGLDLEVVVPVGQMADATGPQLGPLLKAGVRTSSALELRVRLGYLAGFNKTTTVLGGHFDSSISNMPIWFGVRFYPDEALRLYLSGDVALNVLMDSGSGIVGRTHAQGGFNVGIGSVLSPSVPIDIGVQFCDFDPVEHFEQPPSDLLGVGFSVGYSLSL